MKNKVDKKETRASGMPWEGQYGYAQALKIGRSVWISGQLGADSDGKLLEGMEAQMQQTYANIEKLLLSFDMSMESIVDETLYVTDIPSAFESRAKLGRLVYSDCTTVPSTLVQIQALALPGQLVEIKVEARKLRNRQKKAKEEIHTS